MTRAERIAIRDANLKTERGTYVEMLAALKRLRSKSLAQGTVLHEWARLRSRFALRSCDRR